LFNYDKKAISKWFYSDKDITTLPLSIIMSSIFIVQFKGGGGGDKK